MRNTFSKRIFAVLAAALLGAALCAPLTFADEAETADTTDSTETVDTTEGTTDTAGEDSSGAESFFNELKADNGVGRTLFIAGACASCSASAELSASFCGSVQAVTATAAKRTAPRCWMRLSRRNDATAEDAKKSACAASRCRRAVRQSPACPRPLTRIKIPASCPVMPVSAEYTAERPIMPETPVSMQPQNVRRAAVQTSVNRAPRQSAAPRAAKPAAPAPKPVQQRPANTPKPAAQTVQAKPARAESARKI